ncbi:MAG: Holliday junction branch migration protein RuvA [bacterium]
MIGRLSGKLIELDATHLLIDVAGVAYEVEVSANVLQLAPQTGTALTLFTHFVVREDAQLLFGFASKDERDLFRAFIRINGVGPKLGLALISALDPHTLGVAVRDNNVAVLTKVPGVGRKTAERLMVELKSRIDQLTHNGAVPAVVVSADGAFVSGGHSQVGEAEDALIALGYRPAEAQRAVAAASRQVSTDQPSAEALVRLALRGFVQSSGAP